MASIGMMHVHFHTGIAGCSSESDSVYGIAWPSTGVNMIGELILWYCAFLPS